MEGEGSRGRFTGIPVVSWMAERLGPRRQSEAHTTNENLRPWQEVADEMRSTNIGGLVAAERAFSLTLLNRLINRSQILLPIYGDVPVASRTFQDGDKAVNGQKKMYNLPYEQQRTEQDHLIGELFAEYQSYQTEQHEGHADEVNTVPDSLYPVRIGPETMKGIMEDRDRIFNQVARFSDTELEGFEQINKKAQRKIRRKVPGAQEMIDHTLLSAKDIEPTLPENRRLIAEMNFSTTLLSTLLMDANKNVPKRAVTDRVTHKPLPARDEQAVLTDLSGLLTAYDRIQLGQGPEEGKERYYSRVAELVEGLDKKRDNIYRTAATISNESVADFENCANRAVQLLAGRRLHGAQRELVRERIPGVEIESVVSAYKSAFKKNVGWFTAENVLAAAIAYGVTKGVHIGPVNLPGLQLSSTVLNPVAPASEAVMDAALVGGGIAVARLIEETGSSLSIVALALHDAVSTKTDNRFLKETAATIGHSLSQDAAEKILWGAGFAAALGSGAINPREFLSIVLWANAAGIAWQGATAVRAEYMKHKDRRLRQHNREGNISHASTITNATSAVADAAGNLMGLPVVPPDKTIGST